MNVSFDFEGDVALITGVSGSLGSSVARVFAEAGATVVGTDIRNPSGDESELDPVDLDFYEADLTDETAVTSVIESIVDEYGRLDYLLNVTGTWMGGDPIHRTDEETVDALFDVNLKTMFLASKHAIPQLVETEGAIVSVSSKSSLSGGNGDGPYRAAKAGVRLLTESIAAEQKGVVRANAVMPSIIDTPENRSMLPEADHDSWADPREIALTIAALCSDAAAVTSGAAVPVYGES